MPRYRGVGPRIRQRLLDLGYVQPTGEPDVRRFCLDCRYDKSIFYEWAGDRSTPSKDLARLAKDLQTTEAFLIFGVDVPLAATTPRARRADRTLPVARPPRRTPRRVAPIRGGSAQTPPPPGPDDDNGVLLIRRWRYYGWGAKAA